MCPVFYLILALIYRAFGLELITVAILLTSGGVVVVLVGCILVDFANVFVVCTSLLLVCSFSVVLFT